MGPVQAIRTCLRKPFRFSGRASRSEFWWFAGFYVGGAFAAFWLTEWGSKGAGLKSFYTMVAWITLFLTPLLAASWRRHQDIGRVGWPTLIPFSILLGGIGLGVLQSWLWPEELSGLMPMLVGYAGFLITSVFVYFPLIRNSKPGPNPLEVTP